MSPPLQIPMWRKFTPFSIKVTWKGNGKCAVFRWTPVVATSMTDYQDYCDVMLENTLNLHFWKS